MREILFRGKRIDNGEWVYGYFVKYKPCASEDKIVYGIVPTYASELYLCEVDPKTVSQYAGLYDRNGLKLFEDDIVIAMAVDNDCNYGVIKCGPYNSNWRSKDYGFYVDWKGVQLRNDLCFWTEREEIYVIGNISDNPELLEVKQNDN